VRDEGWAVNRKKIQRLWREEGLRVPQRKRKRQRLGDSTCPPSGCVPSGPTTSGRWTSSSTRRRRADVEAAPRRRRAHSRSLGDPRRASIDADHAVRVLDQIVRERGIAPELMPMDNGPEMTANAVRDWCRLGGSGRGFIEPGSPWQNPFRRVVRLTRPRRGALGRGVRLRARGPER